jgi:hypothetical protein
VVCDPSTCAATATECQAAACDPESAECRVFALPEGSACGDASTTDCVGPSTCDGKGGCLPNHLAAGTPCGEPADECSGADTCDGQGGCLPNHLAAGTHCGAPADVCSGRDTCDGAGGCLANHRAAGTLCGDAATPCSEADTCDGAGGCQPNHLAAGTACGDPAANQCTSPDTCDGQGVCLANHAADDTTCACDSVAACVCRGGACSDPCGNGVREPALGEECDGRDAELCEAGCANDCRCAWTTCASLHAAAPGAPSGLYSVDSGAGEPLVVWCDMETAGGGWTRFWWYEAGAGLAGENNMLGAELADCNPLGGKCLGRIPYAQPQELLVYTNPGLWAVWTFDAANQTSNGALAALRDGRQTQWDDACGPAWNPSQQSASLGGTFNCDETSNHGDDCDCFFYGNYDGVKSFTLDDDIGWLDTGFAAGIDQMDQVGVDALELVPQTNSEARTLILYVR